jgi:hypothetical protein
LSTCRDITLGLIAVLGVIDPGSGYTVALGKLLRGGLGSRVERNTVPKSTKSAETAQGEIRTPDDLGLDVPWLAGYNQPTKATLTTSVPSMALVNGDLLRYIFDTWANKKRHLFDDSGLKKVPSGQR